jgi:hypothetical protein
VTVKSLDSEYDPRLVKKMPRFCKHYVCAISLVFFSIMLGLEGKKGGKKVI